jgi:hypothetical protein
VIELPSKVQGCDHAALCPFGETKEMIGGYWFILANDLDEAAQIAKGNPCLDCGLFFEIRPIDSSTN